MDLEDRLKQQLVRLQREYQQRAQPIIDQLASLEALKPPRPLIITGFRGKKTGDPDFDAVMEDLARRIDDE